jgi:hypothetical protein
MQSGYHCIRFEVKIVARFFADLLCYLERDEIIHAEKIG